MKRKKFGADHGRRGLSRREFLAGTTAAGVALGLPSLIAGCGSDDCDAAASPTPTPTPPPGARPREARTLHFDFSYAALDDIRLSALNSASHGVALVPHDDESRARFRDQNPLLRSIADERLTHYVEHVDLPSDALQHVWFTGTVPGTGETALAGLIIHVPQAVARATAQAAAARGRSPAHSAKLRAYGVATNGQMPDGMMLDANDYQTPFDTAAALVFHNPEVMNLDVGQGSTILNLINTLPCADGDPSCQPYLATLAFEIATRWPATTSGGWATLVAATDYQGNPVLDDSGMPVYRFELDPTVAKAVCTAAAEIKKQIFDDPAFAGTNWHPTQGMTVQSAVNTMRAALRGRGTTGLQVVAAHGPGSTAHGVHFTDVSVTDQANRTVELKFRNAYLRYLSTYVQFANEAGDLPVQNPSGEDSSRAKFLKWINSNYTVLGIPLIGDAIPESSVEFNVPADASIAKVYFGSLGLGGEAFSPEAVDGSILTLILDIGVPAILLAAGALITGSLLASLSGEFGVGIIQILRASLPLIIGTATPDIANGIFGTINSDNATGVLTSLANAVLSAFFSTGSAAAFLIALGAVIAGADIINSVPFIGLAFQLTAIAADLATIAQSVGEVLASPAIFKNQISLQMTTTVTLHHDPDDFQFPATARNYEVILTYDSVSKMAHKRTGTIEQGTVDPIVVVFDDVPSGGMVTVDVYLTTESDCIVGRSMDADGNVGPVGPLPGTQAAIDVTIKELLIPLTADTQYQHELKLEYQNGQHVWVAGAAPTATQADLVEGKDDALNALVGITISQRTGMAGYGYLAGGQGVPFCGQSTSGIMHVLQNVFLGQDPDRALKQLPCGFEQAAGIVYDKLGPASGIGRNFFLQPTTDGLFLRSITLDDGTPIDLDSMLSWGRFKLALDSLAVVPTGYVVGVDRQNHKMQILELPPQAVNDQEAPQAVPFAVMKMGLGTRPGLLAAPVAVAVIDAAILILEDGNKRIQAVDVSANPVLRFQSGTTSIVELDDDPGVTYLDLGVDGKGYLFVLSFAHGGAEAADYRLDIYDPQGNFLTRTSGMAAARMAVDTFRNVYTLNYEAVANAPRVEPSLSQWSPSTPAGCPTPPAG